jgi:general secretion pathway protein G
MRRKRPESGFSLIEVLVVVAIIGILSALAIVNYINAMTRARQKRTAADIRNIAAAWEARATDMQNYNVGGADFPFPSDAVEPDDLAAALMPTYSKTLPRTDAWARPLQFAVEIAPDGIANSYAIRSAGRDGDWETGPYTPGPKQDPDCDIVYAAGGFVSYPDTVTTER